MSEKNLPNIFLLLDLDPDTPWNQAEFERQLQKKRQEWSRFVNMPNQKGIQAKQNLGLIPDLKKIAADQDLRQAQVDAARQEKIAARAGEIKEFEERLHLFQVKGHILEDELSLLIKEFGKVLTEPEIRARISVPIRNEQHATHRRATTLDPTKAKEIQNRLMSLGKVDLYDFLGIGRADSDVLRQAAQKRYDEVQKKGKKTADDTTIAELSGHCLVIFKSETERAKYDETLRLQEYEGLKIKVDAAAEVSKKVEARQIEELLREARQKNLDLDEALAIIQGHASKKGISILLPEAVIGAVKELQYCGYCNRLNAKDNSHCSSCGQLLRDACPKCGQMVSTADTACGKCGFPTGNRLYVTVLLGDIARAHASYDLDAAMNLLEQAQHCWPAAGSDSLSRQVKELDIKIKQDKQAQDDLVHQLDAAIANKRLYEARGLLFQLERQLPAGHLLLNRYRSVIEPKIQKAETRLNLARKKSETDIEAAIDLYQEILGICLDCQEARNMLAHTPPAPPLNLRAHASKQLVHLSWEPSPSHGVSYLVVRKKQSRPVSASDGEQVGVVEGTLFDDKTAEVGVPLFYAIYSNREGILSKNVAILSQPIILLQEVSRLIARTTDSQVQIQWESPPNVHQVLAVRSESRYSTRVEEGVLVSTLGDGQLIDNQVKNGQRYFYTIFCQFLDHTGKPLLTRGANIEAIPQQPPEPITDISITTAGPVSARQILINWEPIMKGQAAILKASQPTGLRIGDVLPQKELSKYGQLLPANMNRASDQIDRLGFFYYLPVVIFQDLAYVGKEKQYVCIEDISDLTVTNLGHSLRMQWCWPPNCDEVVIAYSHKDWPALQDLDVSKIPLTRAQYELHGHYDIPNPTKADYYLVVFANISQGDEKITSSGEERGSRKLVHLTSRISIKYQITRSWLSRRLRLKLSIEGQGDLPNLVLTAKQATLPMNKSDGIIIWQLDTIPIRKNQMRFMLPASVSQRQSYAKLFLENDELYDAVIIRHPDPQKLRLF